MPGETGSDSSAGSVSPQTYAAGPTAEPPVTAAARRTMQSNRGRDTGPELAVRSLVHLAGLRYRVNSPLPFDRRRRADLAFTRVGLYVFIDGCFWHGCPEHFVIPKTRTEFWLDKIEGNQTRDRDTDAQLCELGLTSLRFWEHAAPVGVSRTVVATYARLADNAAGP